MSGRWWSNNFDLRTSPSLSPHPQQPLVPFLPNWDNGQEGETGGQSKAGAYKLVHGELIDLVIYGRCHHPSQSERQLQHDKHLSCGRDRGYTEMCCCPLFPPSQVSKKHRGLLRTPFQTSWLNLTGLLPPSHCVFLEYLSLWLFSDWSKSFPPSWLHSLYPGWKPACSSCIWRCFWNFLQCLLQVCASSWATLK